MVYILLLKFTVTEYYRFVQIIFVTEMPQAERMTFFLIFIILTTLKVLQLTRMFHRYPCWVEWINGLLHGPFHKIYFPLTINQYNAVGSATGEIQWYERGITVNIFITLNFLCRYSIISLQMVKWIMSHLCQSCQFVNWFQKSVRGAVNHNYTFAVSCCILCDMLQL